MVVRLLKENILPHNLIIAAEAVVDATNDYFVLL